MLLHWVFEHDLSHAENIRYQRLDISVSLDSFLFYISSNLYDNSSTQIASGFQEIVLFSSLFTKVMTDVLNQTLQSIKQQLYRYVPIAHILLGTFGNVMNSIIFMRPSLRSNPCSYYFWVSSINNIFYLYVGLLTRMLATGWDLNPIQYSNALCKLRMYFVYTSSSLIEWYMVVASIDRYLSSCSSARIRQWSSVKMARKVTLWTTVIVVVVYFHVPVGFSNETVDGLPAPCDIYNHQYQMFFSIFDIVFSCILPPSLMIVCGLKTISNFRRLRRTVMPTDQNDAREIRLRRKDRQMVVMLFIQIAATMVVNIPYTGTNVYYYIYDSIGLPEMDEMTDAITTFLAYIFLLTNYLAPVLGFYIYTLSGSVFRHELTHILRRALAKLLVTTKIDRCLPEQMVTKLYQNDETVFTQQAKSSKGIHQNLTNT